MKTSKSPKLLGLTLVASGLLVQTASALITIDTVPVGNAGNAADPTTGYGAVGYDYSIGKYEVTLNQYTAFLNAVGATDTYGLYDLDMINFGHYPGAGIERFGASGSYTYSVSVSGSGSGNRPVTYVSWYNSARFANWLHNGQPTGMQVAGTTETGAYTLTGNSGIITRNANATYGLPSENEWYKAAYYQPAAQGGDSDNYWLYPTQSNEIPNSHYLITTDPNSANFFRDDGIANRFNNGYAVRGYPDVTDVGMYSLADSFYGTFDQGGNVWEWNDGNGATRGLRGGSYYSMENNLRSSYRGGNINPEEFYDPFGVAGFRIALIPEPSLVALMGLGIALLAWKRK